MGKFSINNNKNNKDIVKKDGLLLQTRLAFKVKKKRFEWAVIIYDMSKARPFLSFTFRQPAL